MFRENEDKIMKAPGICFDGSSCRHMFAPFVRVKRPGSHVKDLHWLCILLLLVVLLAGQASCNETTASSLSSPTTNAQTSVFYHVAVTVDVNGQKDESNITAWLEDVFRNNLQSCVSQINEQTTATPASPHTTSASTSNVTTLMTPATATLQSSNTTTAAANTTLQSYSTTPAATTLRSSNTTTTATTASESSNTTSPATTAVKGSNTTTPATTAVKGSNTTATTAFKTPTMTIAATTALQSTIITTPATTTVLKSTTMATPATTASKTTTMATAATTASETTTMATAATTASETTTMATPATTASETTTVATPATTASKTTTVATAATTASETTTVATAATTASETTTMATAATTTAIKSTTMTTFATTALQTSTKTATATTTASETIKTTTLPVTGVITQTVLNEDQNRPTKRPPPSQANKERVAREIRNSVTQTSAITNDLYQGIDVSCTTKTAIRKTNCSVTLQLRHSIPPCCILRTLCAASKASSDIHVVGKKADRIRGLENGCNSNIQEENSCVYTGQAGAACQETESAYVIPQRNTTHCDEEKGNNVCNCSAYCSGTDAYYTFEIFIKDTSKMNLTYVSSLISKLKQQPNCPPSAEVPCPSSILASEYKDANVTCGLNEANLQSCSVILVFAHEVPICNVSTAVINVFQSVKEISFNGQVTRAAICGNSEVNSNPLKSEFKWDIVYLKPASFCTTEESNNLTCPNGVNVLVLMDEQCNQRVFTTPSPNVTTTLSPNVTTAEPNTTTPSANVTSSPLNTTAQALNATTTSSPANVTATADSQANALLDLTGDVSSLNSSQVDQLVSQLENLLSGPTVSLALGNTSVRIVSNLLGASPEVLSDSSNRIIGIVDTVGLKLVLDGEAQTLLSPAVALSVKPADGSNFQETFFSISDPNDVQVRGDPRLRRSVRKDSSIPQGSIRLPPTLTQSLTSEQQQLVSRVQFNFYQESTVYQDRSLGKRKLNSGILGASVANLSIKELQDDVVIHLKNMEPVPANFVATCVFWDFTLNDGSGGWNPRGCSVRNSTDNETICGCNHLTSFAILLDLSRETLTSRVQATILTFITYIGCGISAIFLSITLLTYLSFGKLRKDIPSKILIQLCMALLLLNLVFLVDAWLALYPDAVGLCISTAWFLHYFLLVTFTWMGLEAVHMYVALVKVFNSHVSRYMLKFSVVGWGVPMIVVIIVIAIDKDNYGLVSYGKFSDGTSDDFCWLKNDIAFYVAVVAYFCVIFLFNLAMFVVVLVQLCRIKRQNPHNAQHRTTLQDVRSVAGITVLLGLTWGFAFFAWGPLNLPFMYLFAIFNSLQGFFIFVFYCAVKENVRRQWRTYLCCGKMRLAENSEWSRTATQKTVKKSSMTKLRSLNSSKSSQSNNSSSSTSFLVSDSSEQINGIGSPFEDRIITADEDPSMDVVLNEINRQYRDRQAS
ncbi:adhesion G-protein coupled receptor G2 [Epinephelus moara]|uniref:adhesion G-protein coupled receptor G2 n=1 Tax=Epinephelus moara TaxID=300413 RepID=UPI00214ECB8A|nr:adhesion G-protein coupled receptor G2 [Epinephelus moara]